MRVEQKRGGGNRLENATGKYRPTGVAWALIFMFMFLGALGLRFWASSKAAAIAGPDHIAADGAHVYVHANGELLTLAPDGELQARHPLKTVIADDQLIDLRVLSDGRLLLARRQPAGFYTCEPVSWHCRRLTLAVAGELRDQYKAFPDAGTGRLLVSDFSSGRLWSQSLAGGDPRPLSTTANLKGPNDLALGRDGSLWVADSAGRRLVVLEPAAGEWRRRATYSARTRYAPAGRDWPMMLAQAPDGDWWVTQPTPLGGRADLVVYHGADGAVARVALPDGADATDVAASGGVMLVTDMINFHVYRVDAASRAVSEFGDAPFRTLLRGEAERRAGYRRWMRGAFWAMIAFAGLMLLAAAWATPRGKRWTKAPQIAALEPGSGPAPALGRIHWLRRNPKSERMLRWAMPASYAAAVLMLVLFVLFYFTLGAGAGGHVSPPQAAKMAQATHELMVLVLLTAAMPILVGLALRNMRGRLGTDGRALYVKLADGGQLTLPPERLVYDAGKIVYCDRMFPVRTGNRQALYQSGEIETFIAPLLARAKKLGTLDMLRYQLVHREPVLVASLAYAAVAVILFTASGMWHDFLH